MENCIMTNVLETGYDVALSTGFDGSLVLFNIHRDGEIIKEIFPEPLE